MKKMMLAAEIAAGFMLLTGCILPPEAGIRITSEGNAPIEFTGYYGSQIAEVTEVDGVTAASYKVKVNTESDHIKAAFVKKDTSDSESKLRVRLFYRGIRKDITLIEPGDSAVIDYKVKK